MAEGLIRQFVSTFGFCYSGAGLRLCPKTIAGSYLVGPLWRGKAEQLGVTTPADLASLSGGPFGSRGWASFGSCSALGFAVVGKVA